MNHVNHLSRRDLLVAAAAIGAATALTPFAAATTPSCCAADRGAGVRLLSL
jgi:hypothetical protein